MNREWQRKGIKVMAAMLAAVAESMAQDRPRREILISVPDRKLALIEDGEVIRIYPIAVGAAKSPSPKGDFQIVQRIQDPAWYRPGKVVPPGKFNPLGTRWLGLSRKGYGIHGTNNPRSIGRPASHGCIRMRNADVEELFEQVGIGDLVELRAERDEEVTRVFGTGMKAQPAEVAVSGEVAGQ